MMPWIFLLIPLWMFYCCIICFLTYFLFLLFHLKGGCLFIWRLRRFWTKWQICAHTISRVGVSEAPTELHRGLGDSAKRTFVTVRHRWVPRRGRCSLPLELRHWRGLRWRRNAAGTHPFMSSGFPRDRRLWFAASRLNAIVNR